MKHMLVALVAHALLFAQIGNVVGVARFDGEWNGSATATAGRCKPAVVTVTVKGREVTGQARFELDAPSINGTVQEDGTSGATIGWQPLTGKFADEGFEGTFKRGECTWKLILHRTK